MFLALSARCHVAAAGAQGKDADRLASGRPACNPLYFTAARACQDRTSSRVAAQHRKEDAVHRGRQQRKQCSTTGREIHRASKWQGTVSAGAAVRLRTEDPLSPLSPRLAALWRIWSQLDLSCALSWRFPLQTFLPEAMLEQADAPVLVSALKVSRMPPWALNGLGLFL